MDRHQITIVPLKYKPNSDIITIDGKTYGDYNTIIETMERENDTSKLLLFNDNIEHHCLTHPGAQSANIRPYNLYSVYNRQGPNQDIEKDKIKQVKSVGISTGSISNGGFLGIYSEINRYKIRTIIKTRNDVEQPEEFDGLYENLDGKSRIYAKDIIDCEFVELKYILQNRPDIKTIYYPYSDDKKITPDGNIELGSAVFSFAVKGDGFDTGHCVLSYIPDTLYKIVNEINLDNQMVNQMVNLVVN
jgi:hypothetical protein